VREGGVSQGLTVRTQGLTIGTAEPINVSLNSIHHIHSKNTVEMGSNYR
jgi:hypothetical protein